MNSIVKVTSTDISQLEEFQNWEEKQRDVVRLNPFVIIEDNITYDEAKRYRTALVSARTAIQAQDKTIASALTSFRRKTKEHGESLIEITLPHEAKQQEEITRWEQIKADEKAEIERKENERKEVIKRRINEFYNENNESIKVLFFKEIDSFKSDFENKINSIDLAEFEEFEIDFLVKKDLLINFLYEKIKTLKESESMRVERVRLEEIKKQQEIEKTEIERERRKLAEEESVRLEKIQREEKERLDKIAKEKAVAEEKEAAKKQLLEQEEKDRKARIAKEEYEAQKKIADAQAKARAEEAERLAKIEAREKVIRVKEEEEAEKLREEKDKEEAEKAAKIENIRQEALKPHKQKAIEFIYFHVLANEIPELNEELRAIMKEWTLETIALNEKYINKISTL